MCPLHPADCNPSDPVHVHATAHRSASQALKTYHYALLYSPGADPVAQQDAWDTLARIPKANPAPSCETFSTQD